MNRRPKYLKVQTNKKKQKSTHIECRTKNGVLMLYCEDKPVMNVYTMPCSMDQYGRHHGELRIEVSAEFIYQDKP